MDPNIFPAEPWGTAPNNLAPFTINNGVIASIAQTGVSGSVPVGGGFYSYVVTAPPDVEWRAKPLVSGVTLLSSEVDSEGSATRLIAVGPQAVSSPQNVLQVHPFAPYAPFVNVSSLLLGAQDTQVQTFPFPIQAAGQPPPPDLPSISPASGSGEFATFTITITNYHGNRSMAPVELIINSGFTTAGSCYVYFFGDIPNTPNYPLTAYVGLGAEGGNPDGWIRFNQAGSPYASGGTLSNAYCELIREEAGVPTTSVQYNPNLRSIQLRVRLRFQSTFRGLRQLYVRQRDRLTGNSDQVHTLGSWTPFPPLPVTVSLLSASSSPAAQGTFTYRVTNQNGATDTVGSQLFFVPPNQPETSTQACIGLYYWYSPPVILVFDPTIQMYRQFGSVPTGAPPNQCRILSFSTTVVNSTTRDITWQMGFTGIPGLKNVYLKAISNASPQGQSPITTWTVQ